MPFDVPTPFSQVHLVPERNYPIMVVRCTRQASNYTEHTQQRTVYTIVVTTYFSTFWPKFFCLFIPSYVHHFSTRLRAAVETYPILRVLTGSEKGGKESHIFCYNLFLTSAHSSAAPISSVLEQQLLSHVQGCFHVILVVPIRNRQIRATSWLHTAYCALLLIKAIGEGQI